MTTAAVHAGADPRLRQPLPPPQLAIGSYRLHFKLLDDVRLPPYTGSTWRGLFGHTSRKLSCATGAPTWGDCPLSRNCNYHWLFETPNHGRPGVLHQRRM